MNLVCFANHTAGGLVCDLLNNVKKINMYGMRSIGTAHGLFKIGDVGSVCRNFNEEYWNFQKTSLKSDQWLSSISDLWTGTHCHPSCIPEKYLNQFEKILAITTERNTSKLYRYIRLCYSKTYNITEPEIIAAKDVMETFESYPGCINVEFEDIVNGKFVKDFKLSEVNFNKWKDSNKFLYEDFDNRLIEIFNQELEKYYGNI